MLSNAIKELEATKKQITTQIKGLEAQIQKINTAIGALSGLAGENPSSTPIKRRKISAAGRKAMSAAAQARWANVKTAKTPEVKPAKKRRAMSAAMKAKLSAFQKARWAKIKAAKATSGKK